MPRRSHGFFRADNQIMIGFKASYLAIAFGRHTRWQIDNEIKPLFGQGGRMMIVTVPDVLGHCDERSSRRTSQLLSLDPTFTYDGFYL
jgi:hypothetical protein